MAAVSLLKENILLYPWPISRPQRHTDRMDNSDNRIPLTVSELNDLIEQRIENEVSKYFATLQQEENDSEAIQDNGWIRLAMSRETGEIEVPKSLEHIFRKDQMENIYCKSSIAKFLTKHPEPKGVYLKTQSLENQIAAPIEARKTDEALQDIQRNVLCTVRPLLTVYN